MSLISEEALETTYGSLKKGDLFRYKGDKTGHIGKKVAAKSYTDQRGQKYAIDATDRIIPVKPTSDVNPKWGMKHEGESINESNVSSYLTKSSQGSNIIPPIVLTLERKWDAYTGWYRLETDKWFRRYMEPANGHGVMIRKFKVTTGAKPDTMGSQTPVDKYFVNVTYLPNSVPDYDGYDVPANYETAKGFLIISGEARKKVTAKDIEQFINSNLKQYVA